MVHEQYQTADPYPPVQVEEGNPVYADLILSNLGGRNSEISAVSLYLYNHFVTMEQQDLPDIFRGIAIVEMRHFDMFGRTAYLLGADPRLWKRTRSGMQYWTPACMRYPATPRELLQNALTGELAAIEKYRRQAQCIKDPFIVAILNRVIRDEEHHVAIFRELLKKEEPGGGAAGKTRYSV